VAVALAGALCLAFSAILVRLADVAPATAAAFRCLYALPLLALIAWRERRGTGPRAPRGRLTGAVAGVFFGVDLVLWHHAIDLAGAGIATVLGNLQVLFVGLGAFVVFRERPSGRLLFMLPVVLAGVVLISGIIGRRAYGTNPGLGVAFGLSASLTYAAYILVLRGKGAGETGRVAGPLFDATVVAAVTAVALGPVAGGIDLRPSWPSAGWLLLLALTSQIIGWLLITWAMRLLTAVLTATLLLVQPVGSVVLSAAMLGERPSAWQLAGCAIVLVGVLFAARAPEKGDPALARAERGEHYGGDPVGHLFLWQFHLSAEQVVDPLEHHQAGESGEFRVLGLPGPAGGRRHSCGDGLGEAEE